MSLDPRIRALFAGPNYAHVATLMPDGSPHSAPVWIDVEGDDLVFTREESSRALKNLRRDPRVAISIHNVEDPYECAYVRGRVTEFRDGGIEWLHRIAVAYTGVEYPPPVPAPVTVVVVAVEHAGYDHFTAVQHTPPGSRLQLPRG
jgi:PPOX class probable F420-dependent enzyme